MARWIPPSDAKHTTRYVDAPRWDGGIHCSLDRQTVKAQRLADVIRQGFTVREIGGYSCRQNTANPLRQSVHGTGRAIDVFATPNEMEKIANFACVNAYQYDIQYVIYNRTYWGRNTGEYTGPNPHTDHVHIEVFPDSESSSIPSAAQRSIAAPDSGGLLVAAVLGLAFSWKG